MLKHYLYLILRYLFIFFSTLFSLISLAIIVIGLFLLLSDTLKFDDNDKYLSKIISWYFDKDIEFKSIYIKSLKSGSEYYIEVNKLIAKNGDNYSNINIDNIKLEVNIINIFSSKYIFSKIELYKPKIFYRSEIAFEENIHEFTFFNNMFSYVDILYIHNGKIICKIVDKEYNFSEINIIKSGIKNLKLSGSLNYKDNFLYTTSKSFKFKSTKFFEDTNINIKFTDLLLPNFVLSKFNFDNQLSIDMNVSGEFNVTIRNHKLLNVKINILSKHALLNFSEEINYNDYTVINIPKFSNIQLNLIYEFDTSSFLIDNLDFNIQNNNGSLSNIIIKGVYLNNNGNKKINTEISFANLMLGEFIKTEIDVLKDFINLPLYGNGNIKLEGGKVDTINILINDIKYNKLDIRDIKFSSNKELLDDEISFLVKGHINDIKKVLNKYKFLQYKDFNYYNFKAIAEFSVKLNLPYHSYKVSDVTSVIEGKINFENIENGFFNNKYFIDIINFKINFNDDKTNITGSAIINDNILNYNYLKLNNKAARLEINFSLNDQFVNNKYYTTNFIGNIPVKCVINSDIENMEYLCELNLLESQISIPEISFEKNKNSDAVLFISGYLTQDYNFEDINFKFSNLHNTAVGKFKYDKMSNTYFINFDKFIFNLNDIKANIIYKENKEINIDILSGTIDIKNFLGASNNYNISKKININASLDQLIILNDIYLAKSKLHYSNNNSNKKLEITSKYYTNETLSFSLENTKNTKVSAYKLNVSDAGKFFELLKYKTEIKYGILTSEGFIGELDNDNNIMGTISIDNFRIMKAPFFAELLLAASLTGLFDVLNNEGIEFEQFDAQYNGKNNVYKIIKSRAYGFSIGLTGAGLVNFNNKMIDISGSVVPAYKLNTLFNNIPLIGELLSGKEDEGIFAINYNSVGIWNDPEVNINPLSLLTPGILRNIFDF